jgi:hypothetical protein
MKLDKLFDGHILTGVIFGLVIGMYYPQVGVHKDLLSILALVLGLMVVTGGKVLKLGK